jgi:hypothetical protein
MTDCANPMHGPRKAVARVTFPDAQFLETTACRSCAAWQLRMALDLGHRILIEPLAEEES